MKALHEALCALRDAIPALRDGVSVKCFAPYIGICNNVAGYLSRVEDNDEYLLAIERLYELSTTWPERDPRTMCYPVGGEREYEDKAHLWTNPRRLALLDWMIEETK